MKVLRKLLENIEIKLICLLLAIVIWLYASYPKGTEAIDKFITAISRSEQGIITFRKVPIQLLGVQGKWEANPGTIFLEVKCLMAEVELNNLRAVVNLRPKDEANRRVTLTADNVALPKGLIFLKAEPDEIQITPEVQE